MNIIGEIIGVGSIIGIVLMVIAKLLPNDKLHSIGVSVGNTIDTFGRSKLGGSWEKLEDFVVNSAGVFLIGFKVGLDFEGELPPAKKEEKKKNVRK